DRDEARSFQDVVKAMRLLRQYMADEYQADCTGAEKMSGAPAKSYQAFGAGLKEVRAAIKLLNEALLYNPEDATAMYARAMRHMALGETELADRDLRRMMAVEKKYPSGGARYARLERLQGRLRAATSRLETKIAKELAKESAPAPAGTPSTPAKPEATKSL